MSHIKIVTAAALCLLIFILTASAQEQASSPWATDAGSRYWVQPDIVYQGASGQSLKLDVWYQHDIKTPSPTLVYIHGGGWIFGSGAAGLWRNTARERAAILADDSQGGAAHGHLD